MNNNQSHGGKPFPRSQQFCSAIHSIPCHFQYTYVHSNFHHSLTHTLSRNYFSPPIFCSHIYSSLNITVTAHMFGALQNIMLMHQNEGQKKVTHCQTTALFPNPVYSLSSMSQTKCHTHSYENMLTHKHVFISIVMLSESRKGSKTLQSCSAHYSKIFSSRFLDSAIFIP